jgi:lipopolysaccharide/colanic/teichoic acid biosynthesis glycosyltransferase
VRNSTRSSEAGKRLLDLALATGGLIALAPVLASVAVVLLITQGRPILFRQERPGRDARPFRIAKFRTMRAPRPDEIAYLTDDLRLTRLGGLLRSSSIDELPELWNMLRGEMSLVGPRPLLMEYLDAYTPRQRHRHDVRPGITGWAAVNGRHASTFADRIELDLWYVEHRNLRLDLKILGMTVRQVMARSHVSTTQDPDAIGFPLPGSRVTTPHDDSA